MLTTFTQIKPVQNPASGLQLHDKHNQQPTETRDQDWYIPTKARSILTIVAYSRA